MAVRARAMKYNFGKAKTNHTRKPADWEKYPVWVNRLDGGDDDADEEQERPMVGVRNVNRDVLNAGLVTIALRMSGSEAAACGYLDFPDGDALVAVWVWQKGQWQEPRNIPRLRYPLHFESVPTIKNKPATLVIRERGDAEAKAVTTPSRSSSAASPAAKRKRGK
jgi:hypothetical protein